MHVQALPWEMMTTGVGRIVPRCFFSRHGLSFQSSSSLLFIPRKGIGSFIFQTWPFDRTNRRGKFRSYRDESERESEKEKGKDSRTILRGRTPAPDHRAGALEHTQEELSMTFDVDPSRWHERITGLVHPFIVTSCRRSLSTARVVSFCGE
jgi:hypothetical protein